MTNSLQTFFHLDFAVRGFEAGLVVALVLPLIGIFLVLRRYSLIADTLSHVSLAGVAIGLLFGLNPILTAIGTTVISSLAIEQLRTSRRIYGESALSLFLSGSLALALIILSLSHGFSVNLSSYLFGSIVTVTPSDLHLIIGVGLVVTVAVFLFGRAFSFISFDEEAAIVSGLPVRVLNLILIALAGLVIAVAIPIVGVLLISALMVIPVLTALQFHRSFLQTLLIAECASVLSVVFGMLFSWQFNLSTSGMIVTTALIIFMLSLWQHPQHRHIHTSSSHK